MPVAVPLGNSGLDYIWFGLVWLTLGCVLDAKEYGSREAHARALANQLLPTAGCNDIGLGDFAFCNGALAASLIFFPTLPK